MSRIGLKLIPIPEGTTVNINNGVVEVKGKNGEDKVSYDPNLLEIKVEDGNIHITRKNEEKHTKQMHGTTRAILNNVVCGTHEHYVKTLDMIGIGYKAEMAGENILLHVGYSHTITIKPLKGVKIAVVQSKIKDVTCSIEVSGSDKFAVGQTAALIRDTRRPEPYQGKGIKYRDEHIIRKEGKRAAAGGTAKK